MPGNHLAQEDGMTDGQSAVLVSLLPLLGIFWAVWRVNRRDR